MIQRVNLYTEELRPRKEKLQAGTALAIVGVGLLLIILASGVMRFQNTDLAARVTSLEQRNQQLERAVAQLEETVQARQPDADLESELAEVTETLARRQRLLEKVENLVLSEDRRFSPGMAALARQIPEDVWLTGITLAADADQVVLEGRSRNSALVPQYLERLGQEPAFAGKTFGAFRLSRPEERPWIEFHVASQRTGEGD
ncbi:MAG: PilN domain-containing protein [Pseudomonadota bacterium]|nr:PilN domain-containing protein [Pseudomonadota bacterium]